MKMNRYYFTTKSRVITEIVVVAEDEDEAWDMMLSGDGEETEVEHSTFSEELDFIEEVKENEDA